MSSRDASGPPPSGRRPCTGEGENVKKLEATLRGAPFVAGVTRVAAQSTELPHDGMTKVRTSTSALDQPTLPCQMKTPARSRDLLDLFAALGGDVRLHLFEAILSAGATGTTPCQLSTRFALPDATLSFHLSKLKRAGLVSTRERGKFTFYLADREPLRNGLIALGELYLEHHPLRDLVRDGGEICAG